MPPQNGEVGWRFPAGGDYMGFAAAPDGQFVLLWADSRSEMYQLRTATLKVNSSRPGGPGRLPARASHGSGHAGLPHPARQVTDLLREARTGDGPPAPEVGSAARDAGSASTTCEPGRSGDRATSAKPAVPRDGSEPTTRSCRRFHSSCRARVAPARLALAARPGVCGGTRCTTHSPA